jgi:lysophospholipase L1-like esterase
MRTVRGFVHVLILLIVLVIIVVVYILGQPGTNNIVNNILPVPTPTPYQFPYKNPIIPKDRSYRMVIVGDSIVNSLGLNANVLRQDLIKHYPTTEFVTYNYGYSATNVLSLYKRLTEKTVNSGSENPAILKQGFELIIIESFGNNPLSEFSIDDGLKKQNEELDKSVKEILAEKPNVALAFMTPIALDPVTYAKGTVALSPEVRKQWVAERVSYIDNHRKFAESLGIPVIDVYKASLKPDGLVDKTYISDDFVHPSKKGIELISKTIADYIFTNKIFPE